VLVRHRLISCWPKEVLVRSGDRRRGMGVVRGVGVWEGILIWCSIGRVIGKRAAVFEFRVGRLEKGGL